MFLWKKMQKSQLENVLRFAKKLKNFHYELSSISQPCSISQFLFKTKQISVRQ